ncbi:sugar-binding transcriptional regulator [Cryobacterium sp. Y57]|uniref:sugar-binding transcriptional regulator n=1 Tax=Cryobacterium sp. Y57 TaxID=2048287 RepID=UPI000CE4C143|nr:sugar-binding domain-containing protein [Cryobacterium sp. Y57]
MAKLREKRLAHAAFLYYIEGLSQADVARILGVTRSNVSRMLSAAREQYIVRFEIAYPLDRDPVLERRLASKFSSEGVRDVIVVPSRNTGVGRISHGLLAVGQACCSWLDINLKDQQRLGLCWGSTMEAMVESAHFDRRIDVEVVQIAGELSIDSRFSGHDLVRNLAEKLGGRYQYFNAPAITPDELTAKTLTKSPQVSSALASARACDVAIVGIGQFGMGSSDLFLRRAGASDAEIQEAQDSGAVGQISGRFYDAAGKQIDLSMNRRVLSLDLAEITTIETVVAVASSVEKAEAVRAAIRGGLVNILVVDDLLAHELAILP